MGILGGVILATLIGQLLLQPLCDGLARLSYDALFLRKREVPDELVMIYLDPKVKRNLGQTADEPLDRKFYVRLLDRLTADGAAGALRHFVRFTRP